MDEEVGDFAVEAMMEFAPVYGLFEHLHGIFHPYGLREPSHRGDKLFQLALLVRLVERPSQGSGVNAPMLLVGSGFIGSGHAHG